MPIPWIFKPTAAAHLCAVNPQRVVVLDWSVLGHLIARRGLAGYSYVQSPGAVKLVPFRSLYQGRYPVRAGFRGVEECQAGL